MRRQVEVYVSIRQINPADLLEIPYYYKLDLFDEESINITNSIKDVRDIAKVFTDYSQQFNVPASTANNKIFKHYYNFDIDGGFDARVKREALIKINGEDYRQGFISLNDVSMKNQQPFSYKVVFYGKTINIKRLFGDDELDSLPDDVGSYLNAFNQIYTSSFAKNGFIEGYNKAGVGIVQNPDGNKAGDLCFPFISGKSHYYYDSTGSNTPVTKTDTPSRNVKAHSTGNGISLVDLKPAIRIYHIIKAIEEKYNITFSTDFFNTSNATFHELYLWLHREAGDLATQIGESVLSIGLGEFTFTNTSPTGNDDPRSNTGNTDLVSSISGSPLVGNRTWVYYKYIISVTASASSAGGTYTAELLDTVTGNTITPDSSSTGVGLGTTVFEFTMKIPVFAFGSRVYTPVFKVKTVGGVETATINSLVIEKYTDVISSTSTTLSTSHYDANYTIANQQVSSSDPKYNTNEFDVSSGLEMSANMPKMKIIDFLTSIFKMFNLIAFYDDRKILNNGSTNTDFGKIKVMTLDDYYSEGTNYDITEYLYTDKHSVGKANIYSEINFKYSDPSTFAIIHSNEITNDEFGNERLDNRSDEIDSPLAFDGGKYDVELGFEHMMYERMTNQSGTQQLTNTQWGWMVSEDENPVLGKPLLVYCHKHATTDDYKMYFEGSSTEITKYIRPANTRTHILSGSTTATDNLQSIHFGEEEDEYFATTKLPNNESLFANFYFNYVTGIYSEKARLSKFKVVLPAKIVNKLKLNDRLIISAKKYKINKIKMNINTGKADLELMNEVV